MLQQHNLHTAHTNLEVAATLRNDVSEYMIVKESALGNSLAYQREKNSSLSNSIKPHP